MRLTICDMSMRLTICVHRFLCFRQIAEQRAAGALFVQPVNWFLYMAASKWFQVICPACQAALQVELNAGDNRVHCSVVLPCKVTFDVYVSPELLQDAVEPSIWRRPEAARREPTAAQKAYRAHLRRELPRLRQQQPNLAPSERMRLAAASWANNPARPTTADDAGAARDATDADVQMAAETNAEADRDEAPPAARGRGRALPLGLGARGRACGARRGRGSAGRGR